MKGRYQGHDFEIRGASALSTTQAASGTNGICFSTTAAAAGWPKSSSGCSSLSQSTSKGAAKIPAFNEADGRAAVPPPHGRTASEGRRERRRPARRARGEIPYDLKPQADYRYADLSGPGGRFATIDYGPVGSCRLPGPGQIGNPPGDDESASGLLRPGNPPGRSESAPPPRGRVPRTAASRGGAGRMSALPPRLTLFVPHKTVRVGCTSCAALGR